MKITIAGAEHALRAPADLDAALIAVSGCNAAETRAALATTPAPARIAIALAPFLVDPMPAATLGDAIGADGGVLAQVLALYDNMPAVAAAPIEDEN